MNERIKLLAEQAKFAIDVSNDPNSPPSWWWGAGHNDRFEKFAELIVRECAHVAVFKDDGRNVEGYMEIYRLQGRSTAAKMIKEHFGVEE